MPFGTPAAQAVDAWLTRGRPQLVAPGCRRRPVRRGSWATDRPACGAHARPPADRGGARRPRHRAARTAAHGSDPPARGRRRPAIGAGAARSRVAGDDAAVHPREHRPAAPGLPSGPPARLTGLPAAIALTSASGCIANERTGTTRGRGDARARRSRRRPVSGRLERNAESGGHGGERLGRHRDRDRRRRRSPPQREQPHGTAADQQEWVEIGVAADPPPVQADDGQAVRPGRARGCPGAGLGRRRRRPGRWRPPARRWCGSGRGRPRPLRDRRSRRRRSPDRPARTAPARRPGRPGRPLDGLRPRGRQAGRRRAAPVAAAEGATPRREPGPRGRPALPRAARGDEHHEQERDDDGPPTVDPDRVGEWEGHGSTVPGRGEVAGRPGSQRWRTGARSPVVDGERAVRAGAGADWWPRARSTTL